MIRQALIPAAGRGARLDRPGTPKPLVDVGGKPMINRLLEQLQRAGIEKTVVVVGYDARKVASELRGHPGFDMEIEVVKNPDWKQGLAASILAAREAISQPFLLAMSDHVFDEELVKRMAGGDPPKSGVTALLDRSIDEVFSLDSAVKVQLGDNLVKKVDRSLDKFDAVDTGLFRADLALFDCLAEARAQGSDELFQALSLMAAQNQVEAVYTDGAFWVDVDTPVDLVHAEMRIRDQDRQRKLTSKAVAPLPGAGKSYDFVTGSKITTQMIVGRGFVSNPGSVPLIPSESASSPIFVFTDDTVHELYGQDFVAKLRGQGYDIHDIVLPDGEEAKTLANYSYLVERVLSRGVDERSVFISLGGGVVCNVCGFVASTIYRGLDLVHLPTTLMAQCDAAISHKQAINGAHGKNMVGSYFPPRLVAVDVEVLSTLSDRLLKDGISEVVKHALGQDPEYVDMLLAHKGPIGDLDFLEKVVRRNVDLKCDLSVNDPKELREAMVLQYGHTVGHPVEHLSGYRLYHGESISIGMMVAARVSRILGACTDDLVKLHKRLIEHFGLPTQCPGAIRTDDMLESLRFNKRYLTEGTRMALLSDVGKLFCVDEDYVIPVSDQVLAEAFEMTRCEDLKLPEE